TKPFGNHSLENNLLSQDKVPSVGQTTSTEFTSNTLKLYLWNSTAKQSIKESDVKYFKALDEYIKKKDSVIFDIRKNYFEFLKSRDQLESNQLKVSVNKEELIIGKALNETLISEILNLKDKLYKALIDFEETKTGYFIAIATINKSIGITDFFDYTKGIEEKESVSNSWKLFINKTHDMYSKGYKEVITQKENSKDKTNWRRR
ncbi:TolC family protein, partial [Chlamydiota bacterium]